MRRLLQTLGVAASLLLFPISIKTQWNNYLPCDGKIAWAELPASFRTSNLIFSNNFTVEGWFYLNQADAPAPVLAMHQEDNALVYRLGKDIGQKFYFELADAHGRLCRVIANALVASGEWLHLAGVLQSRSDGLADLALYVNGRRVAMAHEKIDLPDQITSQAERSVLRLAGDADGQVLSGRLDEVRISTTARYTGPVISSLDNTFAEDAATAALWHFDEPYGRTFAIDASGHNHDLTIIRNKQPWSVRLADFSAEKYSAATLLLSWKTKNETDLAAIEVQRRSALENFARIGYLPAHGGRDQSHLYQFTDVPTEDGRYYYRLKMLNNAGYYRFSPEVGINFAAQSE